MAKSKRATGNAFQEKEKLYKDKYWLYQKYIVEGLSQNKIKELYGISHGSCSRWLKKFGIPSRGKGHHGEKHPMWKGGRRKHEAGYMLVWCHEHPGNNRGYVLEHRIIVEKNIGRYLNNEEIIHHINGDRTDNKIENLQITTQKAHSLYHRMMERIEGRNTWKWKKKKEKVVETREPLALPLRDGVKNG